MYHEPYGPRGAEDERGETWTDLSEDVPQGAEMTPADRMRELASIAGFAAQEPYSPAMAHDLGADGETADAAHAKKNHASHTDPLGSWTGVPEDGEIPTQDQDDL